MTRANRPRHLLHAHHGPTIGKNTIRLGLYRGRAHSASVQCGIFQYTSTMLLLIAIHQNNDRKALRDLQRTPPASPLAKFNRAADIISVRDSLCMPVPELSTFFKPSTRSESSHEQHSTESTPEPDNPILTLSTRWDSFPRIPDGLGTKRTLIRALDTGQAMEEITCTFNSVCLHSIELSHDSCPPGEAGLYATRSFRSRRSASISSRVGR